MKLFNFFKYFLESISIFLLFFLFKILGIKLSSNVSGKIFTLIGPLFRSKKLIKNNLKLALPNASDVDIKNYSNKMWEYYGKILAEYIFLKNFRSDLENKNIEIIGEEILKNIKENNERVIFVSGHFDNFELMAMMIEKSGINLSAIYRPLNNFFINKIMENIRKKYICKNQVKKGRSNIRELLKLFKDGSSIALMIDQRVSESVQINFFNKKAYTTTIPAQFVKKFNCRIVPIYIDRIKDINFRIKIFEPMKFNENEDIEKITIKLNLWLEEMIKNNPSKWIWSHNRWK